LSIWFFLWIIFAAIMAFVTGWSTYILVQQKQAWKNFAEKNKIKFRPGKFFAPCELDGMIDGFMVSFFTGTQQNPEARKNKQLTVLEITDPSAFVDGVALGSEEMKAFIELINTLTWHKIDNKDWKKQNLVASRHKKSVDKFLTEKRIKILDELLNFPSSDVIIILDDDQGVFRFETSNPFTDSDKLEEMLKKLFARIEKLRPSDEEVKQFQSLRKSEDAQPVTIEKGNAEKPVYDTEKNEDI